MKQIRRIGALILSMAMLLAALPSMAAEEAAEPAWVPDEQAQVLQALGVIPAEFNGNAEMTRGEFTQIIANMLGADTSGKTATKFIDVDSRTPQVGAIAAVTEQGYMGGYTDGSFRPAEPMLYVDAIKVLLSVLGYQPDAELSGGYPMGYLITGSTIRLTGGVSGNAEDVLTGGQLVQMIYNTFDIDLRYQKEFGAQQTYVTEKGKTFWSERRNIYQYKGTVSANAYTHLASGNGLDKGWVMIDNLFCSAGESGIENYLGYQVRAYIHQELEDDEGTVLAFEYQRLNTVVEIQSDDIMDATTLRSVEYSQDNRRQRMPVSSTADLIYNGKALLDATDADMKPENGLLTLIDRGSDGVADAVWIDNYVNYAVLGVSAQNETISDQYDQPILKLADAEYTITRDGFPEDFLFIKEWDIVSAAVSKDGEYAKLVVTSNSFSGTIEAMGEDTVTVGGVEYFIASSEKEPMKVGENGTFHLDMFGKVAAFRKDVSEESYAYLVKAGKAGNLSTRMQFQIFDMGSNSEQVLDGAENLTIDDKKLTIDEAIKALEESAKMSTRTNGMSQLIRYRKNSKGEINAIDTVIKTETENENSMELSVASADTKLTYKGMLFSGRVACASSTQVLVVPPDLERTKDYSVTNSGHFSYDGTYYIEAYCMDDALVPEVLLVYSEPESGSTKIDVWNGVFTVDQIVRALNEDYENVYQLRGTFRGAEVSYEVDSDLSDQVAQLERGDILAIALNNNRITAIQQVFDISNPLEYGMNNANYVARDVVTYGKAMYKNNEVLVVALNEELTETIGFEIDRITVVDLAEDTVRLGSVDDISTYGETKDLESSNDVLVYCYYGSTRDIVVFVTE